MNSHGLMKKALEIQNREKKEEKVTGVCESKSEKNSAIVVRDGIFTISDKLEISGIKQDPELKSLVDSVIR